MKSTASTTCSSKVFSIDNVMKDPFEPLTQSIITEQITTKELRDLIMSETQLLRKTQFLKQQMEQELQLNQIRQIWKSISKGLVPYGEAKTTVEQLIQSKLQGEETEWAEDLNEVFSVGWICSGKDCAIISELRTIEM